MKWIRIVITGSLILLIFCLWGCLGENSGEDPPGINLRGRIDSNTDEYILYQRSGRIEWFDYHIYVTNGEGIFSLYTEPGKISWRGDHIVFTDPDGNWDPIPGVSYNVKIIDRSEMKVIYEDDVVAE